VSYSPTCEERIIKRLTWIAAMLLLTLAFERPPVEAAPPSFLECEAKECLTINGCSIQCSHCEDVPGQIKGVCAWP